MLDYIIVGQGIAGSLMAYTLIKKGKKVLVIDDNSDISSSKVAAGVFNPVTGKRKVKTWDADILFDYLNSFYPNLEKELGKQFFFPKPIYMLFESIEEQNQWAGKIADEDYKKILEINTNPDLFKDFIIDRCGGILSKGSGYVDTERLLLALKDFLLKNKAIILEQFFYEELDVQPELVRYKSITSRRIIFCEGYSITNNPFFSWLPLNAVKGELLTIEVSKIPDVVFNKGIFILPISEQKCIVGSTYNWDEINTIKTAQAKQELTEKLQKLLKIDYQIVDHRAGIRPATLDRRPFLGAHPELKNVLVFGGLGTKGVSIAPYYAYHFYQNLENGKELDKDVNISRHYSLHYLIKQ